MLELGLGYVSNLQNAWRKGLSCLGRYNVGHK